MHRDTTGRRDHMDLVCNNTSNVQCLTRTQKAHERLSNDPPPRSVHITVISLQLLHTCWAVASASHLKPKTYILCLGYRRLKRESTLPLSSPPPTHGLLDVLSCSRKRKPSACGAKLKRSRTQLCAYTWWPAFPHSRGPTDSGVQLTAGLN